ncbi:MAG: hypothetical protein ACP5QK_12660, partial [Myxococcota bacterium]
FAHNNTKIWFGKIILDSVECYNDVDCEDGNYCNGYEVCKDFRCQSGNVVDCDDKKSETNDSCDETIDECNHF